MAEKFWCGQVSDKDDFGVEITNVFYDGKTKMGPWANMSPTSFKRYGLGKTGTGLAQKYEKQSDGRWLKTAG